MQQPTVLHHWSFSDTMHTNRIRSVTHMWLLIVLSVSLFIIAYLGWRLICPLPLSPRKRLFLWLLLAVIIIGQRMTWFVRINGHNPAILDAVDWIGFVTLGFVSFVILMLLARDGLLILRWFLRLFRRVQPDQRKIFFKTQRPTTRRAGVSLSTPPMRPLSPRPYRSPPTPSTRPGACRTSCA